MDNLLKEVMDDLLKKKKKFVFVKRILKISKISFRRNSLHVYSLMAFSKKIQSEMEVEEGEHEDEEEVDERMKDEDEDEVEEMRLEDEDEDPSDEDSDDDMTKKEEVDERMKKRTKK